jgi:hypothetical protein
MDAAAIVLGLLLIVLVLWDLFQSVVVPRPTPGWFRVARYLIRGSWRVVRRTAGGMDGSRHDTLLGLYAPAVTLFLLVVWLAIMILGFGLILFGLRGELSPQPPDLGAAAYVAATSLLTLGFGDFVATGPVARIVVMVAAATGLGVVALVVTFLFSLYGSYQRREVQVVTLQAAAGAPPSAVALLETYARLDMTERLPGLFLDWEHWAAEVLDTHVAFPLLGYFRSSHDNLSWISALGTMLDAASLVLTTIEGLPRGEAELCRRVGSHLVEDVTNLGFAAGVAARNLDEQRSGLDRPSFDLAYARLVLAGYTLAPADRAWPDFEAVRSAYAGRLEAMAAFWATPATSWLGTDEAPSSAVHRAAGQRMAATPIEPPH